MTCTFPMLSSHQCPIHPSALRLSAIISPEVTDRRHLVDLFSSISMTKHVIPGSNPATRFPWPSIYPSCKSSCWNEMLINHFSDHSAFHTLEDSVKLLEENMSRSLHSGWFDVGRNWDTKGDQMLRLCSKNIQKLSWVQHFFDRFLQKIFEALEYKCTWISIDQKIKVKSPYKVGMI